MIDPLACIGRPPEHRDWQSSQGDFGVEIDETARIEAFCTVDAGRFRPTTIGARSWAMKGCHIAHDCEIGEDVELAPHVAMGGHVVIGDRVKVGIGAVIRPRVTIGPGARIGMGAVVVKDVPAGEIWVGNPAKRMQSQEDDLVASAWVEWWERTYV